MRSRSSICAASFPSTSPAWMLPCTYTIGLPLRWASPGESTRGRDAITQGTGAACGTDREDADPDSGTPVLERIEKCPDIRVGGRLGYGGALGAGGLRGEGRGAEQGRIYFIPDQRGGLMSDPSQRPSRRNPFPLMDRLGELCISGKEKAAYLWQVPNDEGVRAEIVALIPVIKEECAKSARREAPNPRGTRAGGDREAGPQRGDPQEASSPRAPLAVSQVGIVVGGQFAAAESPRTMLRVRRRSRQPAHPHRAAPDRRPPPARLRRRRSCLDESRCADADVHLAARRLPLRTTQTKWRPAADDRVLRDDHGVRAHRRREPGFDEHAGLQLPLGVRHHALTVIVRPGSCTTGSTKSTRPVNSCPAARPPGRSPAAPPSWSAYRSGTWNAARCGDTVWSGRSRVSGGHVVAQAHEPLADDAGEGRADGGALQPHLEQVESAPRCSARWLRPARARTADEAFCCSSCARG